MSRRKNICLVTVSPETNHPQRVAREYVSSVKNTGIMLHSLHL